MSSIAQASSLVSHFRGSSFRNAVSSLEKKFTGLDQKRTAEALSEKGIGIDLLAAALFIKRNSSQIDEIIHTIGILQVLPLILKEGEIVESLSLAAGNTGRGFDLETNHRIAEFTFIDWKGGSEVIRQNKIFKDFFFLAEENTSREKELYTIGTSHPAKFFESNRALSKILQGNSKLGEAYRQKHGEPANKSVRTYCEPRKNSVKLRDICVYIPSLGILEGAHRQQAKRPRFSLLPRLGFHASLLAS
ncbi:hypothetical protein KBB96_13135 [Luteolibacter ambystomatis]|uniref:Uncharacterized protein n=1 Tax=Luteolibacter ambystomatis TaxID=2824561 RepID=A0A975IYF0_9BACT|nr:hypothetical protein [Luteolibacter ambystomatis]QUE49813.1 hypothetical protein KBB96_13135 [Luteolibacter ambystomatis]